MFELSGSVMRWFLGIMFPSAPDTGFIWGD